MRRRSILEKGITSIGQWIVTISSDSSNIGNTGGSITITSRASREIVYTDGTTKTEIALTSLSTDYGTLSNNVLTVEANTSTSDKLITVTATYKNASNSITITLAGKTVTNYSDWTVSLSADKTSLANVGDTTNITSSASRTLTWTDGGTSTETVAPTLTTDTGSITSNVLTVPLNASTTSKTITVTATYANVSETLTISQAASTKVYGNVVISNPSVSQSVPASGGTYTIIPSYSQTWTWNGVSGTGGTITSGATINYPSGVANGLYTIASLGSTIKTSTTSIVRQASVTLNGKSATQTITFTQAINVITSIDSVVFNAGTYSGSSSSGGSKGATVNLNNLWRSSSKNPDSNTYVAYESNSNYGTTGGAIMNITVTGVTSFTCYIRSYGETSYDYVIISKINATITNSDSYTSSNVYAHSRSNNTSSTSLSNHKAVTYSGLSASSTYKITVIYRKDSSGNSYDDRGYILIPKSSLATTSTPTTGSGVYACSAARSALTIDLGATVYGTLSSGESGINITSKATITIQLYLNSSANWLTWSSGKPTAASRGTTTGDARSATIGWQIRIVTTLGTTISKTVNNTILIVQAANKAETLTISGEYQSWAYEAYADATIDGAITDWSGAYTWDGYITYTSTATQSYSNQPYTTFRFDSSNSYIEFLGTNAVCKSDYYSNYTTVYGFYGVATIGELTAEYRYSNRCCIFGIRFFDDYGINVRYEPERYYYTDGISVAVVSGNFSESSVQASDLPYNAVLFSWNRDHEYQDSRSISYCIKRDYNVAGFLSKGSYGSNYVAYNPGTKKWEGCDRVNIYYYLGSSSSLSEYRTVSDSSSVTIDIRGNNVQNIS